MNILTDDNNSIMFSHDCISIYLINNNTLCKLLMSTKSIYHIKHDFMTSLMKKVNANSI